MNAETEIKENSEKSNIADRGHTSRPILSICVILPLCAFLFIITCQGGLKSSIRGILLGACILLGLFVVKKFYKDSVSWKKRVAYSISVGIISGLLAATVIWLLEMILRIPSLSYNPHEQATESLFWTCPLYGLFMLGGFASAFNLSPKVRYLIVWAGAALVNALGLGELAADPELGTYVWGVLKICVVYYPRGLVNCFMFVLLWNWCAGTICRKEQAGQTTKSQKVINVLIVIGYLFLVLFIFFLSSTEFEMHSVYLANEKFRVRHQNIGFDEKLSGIIVLLGKREYYDCKKKVFCKLPADIEIRDYSGVISNNKGLRVENNRDHIKIEKLKNGKVTEKIIRLIDCQDHSVVNDSVYYRKYSDIFRLSPPNYDTPVLVMKNAPRNCCVSPDEKFIAYYGGAYRYTSRVLCVMNIESKKVRSLKTVKRRDIDVYWFRNLQDFKERLAGQKDTE